MYKILSVLALLVLVSGCVTHLQPVPLKMYSGPDRDLSELASIKIGSNIALVAVNLVPLSARQIKQVEDMNEKGMMSNWKGLHVEPGTYMFLFSGKVPSHIKGAGSFARQTISVEVKAGHSYIPRIINTPDGEGVTFELVDVGLNYNQDCMVGEYPDAHKVRSKATNCKDLK